MRVLILGGSGKMGQSVAFDLAKDDAVEQIGLVGSNADALKKSKAWL
jgi:saccharopine dehydrogenase-like NADP-dependent oxidoreductase